MSLDAILPLLVPLLVLQLALIVIALRDLAKPERRVRGGSKLLWAAIIILLELVGPVVYFAAGPEEA